MGDLPKLKRDWIGRKVRTKNVLRNGNSIIPAGTELIVADNHSGLRLRSEPCEHCGVSIYITRVPESSVTLLPLEVETHG